MAGEVCERAHYAVSGQAHRPGVKEDMVVEVILAAVVVVLAVLVFYLAKSSRKVESRDMEVAFSRVWRDSRLDEKVGELTTHSKNIEDSHKSIEQMLRIPKERASLGEISLEMILTDQLPPDMFHIRSRVLDGKVPDAAIESSVGLICIDSKFPLDNYVKMQGTTDHTNGNSYKTQFIRDVRGHLDKIAEDYVRRDQGSADFAFAYIPSESVYYFLVCEAYDMLGQYVRKGVQVASPLTLSHKIELIKAGVHARKLSDNAEKVKQDIEVLSRDFSKLDQAWRVLYGTHWKNALSKAEDVNQAYQELREDFDRISRLSNE